MRLLPLLLSGIVLLSPPPSPAIADPLTPVAQSPGGAYADHIAEAAARFELPARWISAVLEAESAGDRRARSPKGAMGLMQIMPATWKDLRVRHRLGTDPYDPHDNIIAGAAYIRELFDLYGSPGWIAAYNAGPGRYEASLKGRTLPSETRAYVALVAQSLDAKGPSDSVLAAPSNAVTWTQAPLFVAQNATRQTAIPIPEKRPSSEAQATTEVRDVSAIEPQSDGLFVARASAGRTP
ncbi:lytic transglycosylase domain-containing protein [Asticcacaulis sp. W401b]|uniref:lytic transglycosylase domain-containing protein n=1 Tax=Asticcacaulis sp. W401b TaxID=3388666 RepID=UPI0039709911